MSIRITITNVRHKVWTMFSLEFWCEIALGRRTSAKPASRCFRSRRGDPRLPTKGISGGVVKGWWLFDAKTLRKHPKPSCFFKLDRVSSTKETHVKSQSNVIAIHYNKPQPLNWWIRNCDEPHKLNFEQNGKNTQISCAKSFHGHLVSG